MPKAKPKTKPSEDICWPVSVIMRLQELGFREVKNRCYVFVRIIRIKAAKNVEDERLLVEMIFLSGNTSISLANLAAARPSGVWEWWNSSLGERIVLDTISRGYKTFGKNFTETNQQFVIDGNSRVIPRSGKKLTRVA